MCLRFPSIEKWKQKIVRTFSLKLDVRNGLILAVGHLKDKRVVVGAKRLVIGEILVEFVRPVTSRSNMKPELVCRSGKELNHLDRYESRCTPSVLCCVM